MAVNRPELSAAPGRHDVRREPARGVLPGRRRSATPTWRSGWTSRRAGRAATRSRPSARSARTRMPSSCCSCAPAPNAATGGPEVLLPAGRRVGRDVAPADWRVSLP
ncbi:MAG: hypothetical protein MZV64_42665 [Ignavibacteriales bacterium]|nr:hypothetical protein [Ignavibacteriales bacterium]